MPPFRDGLKRKTSGSDIKEIRSLVENLEFGPGAVDEQQEDGTDEEVEEEEDDLVTDEVVFDSDVDSTLGEEDQQEEEHSSGLSDSHDDEGSEEVDDDDDEEEEEESEDSGAAVTDDDQHSDKSDTISKVTPKSKQVTVDKNKRKDVNNKSKVVKEVTKHVVKDRKQQGGVKPAGSDTQSDTEQHDEDRKQQGGVKPAGSDTQSDTEQHDEVDEYLAGDTSDEEGATNTAGDVPTWWYREYAHVGYSLGGQRVLRPGHSGQCGQYGQYGQTDLVDQFLRRAEDPDFWRTVVDPSTQQEVVLSEEDLKLIQTLKAGRAPGDDAQQYPPWIEWFSREVLQTPLRGFPDHKRSFLPSRTEQKQISRLVHALNMGWIKTRKELAQERKQKKEKRFYDLWGSTAVSGPRSAPAPRRAPPGHGDSYRPPPEYLPAPHLVAPLWAPRSVPTLRSLPAYPRFVRDRFLRCLDLYLAPRAVKMKVQVRAEELVPVLPSPRELQPFPTSESVVYRGHVGPVRSCDMSPCGAYAVSGGAGEVRLWDVATGRCLRRVDVGGAVSWVRWAASGLWLVAAAVGTGLWLVDVGAAVGDRRRAGETDRLLREAPHQHDIQPDPRVAAACKWEDIEPERWEKGVRMCVRHIRDITTGHWHVKGDYLATVTGEAAARSLLVHQISRRRSQMPLSRHRGLIQCVTFHPTRPFLFVATQRNVRIYDLLKRELVKKLTTGAQWISSMAVHPGGDNLVVGSFDRKCIWFDLDLSSAPYQTLRVVSGAVRAVALHARYPLWAAAADRGHVALCHGRVYADLAQCPLLVPLKRLNVPREGDLAGLDLVFHPTQPWLLVALADHTLRLYT